MRDRTKTRHQAPEAPPPTPQKDKLRDIIDKVCTCLLEGSSWHRRHANECRKLLIRGMGRFHDCESCGDSEHLLCLSKLLCDNINYYPHINTSKLQEIEQIEFHSIECFKEHFDHWDTRETQLIEYLNSAIDLSRSVSIVLYEYFCCLAKEVQEERTRAQWVHDNLSADSWDMHDISVKSKWLHEHFEKHGENLDFNIG